MWDQQSEHMTSFWALLSMPPPAQLGELVDGDQRGQALEDVLDPGRERVSGGGLAVMVRLLVWSYTVATYCYTPWHSRGQP